MVPHTGGPETNLVIWREIHALAQVGESVFENTLICQECKYEFPNSSSRCPECSWVVPAPRTPRKKAMTRAEVEEEEGRLRSKLRDDRWNSYDRRWWTWILPTVFGALVAFSYFTVPAWVYWICIGISLVPLSILLPRRLRQYSEFERLRDEAAKLNYFMCPDCGYHLPKGESGEVVCPECARRVDVADLKEIWTNKR